MKFSPVLQRGVLVRRYKRFLADIETLDGSVITVHCPNTGAMTGCSTPGSRVWYSVSDNPKRKYPHTLEIVEPVESAKGRGRPGSVRIGVNPGKANALVEEAIRAGIIRELIEPQLLRREVAVPDESGRFDFGFTDAGGVQGYIEVKSVTLCVADRDRDRDRVGGVEKVGGPRGVGAFPDAVSERALRHVQALVRRVASGERGLLLFCSQHTGIGSVRCAQEIYPEYAVAVREAAAAGVEVLAYGCEVSQKQLTISQSLPVVLDF